MDLAEYILSQLQVSYNSIHKGAMHGVFEVIQPLLTCIRQIGRRNCRY